VGYVPEAVQGAQRPRNYVIHSPYSSRLFEWQEGQNPLVRHENISNLSSPQEGQRMRANPHFDFSRFQ